MTPFNHDPAMPLPQPIVRPPLQAHGSSDSSLQTVSSYTSSSCFTDSTGSSDGVSRPYERVVYVHNSPALHPVSSGAERDGRWDLADAPLGNTSSSVPGTRNPSLSIPREALLSAAPPVTASPTTGPSTTPSPTAWRHQSLPSLITDAERAMQNIRTSAAQSAYIQPTSESPRTGSPSRPGPSSVLKSPSSGATYSPSSNRLNLVSSSVPSSSQSPMSFGSSSSPSAHAADSMSRSTSQSSGSQPPVPLSASALGRPGSAGTFSSGTTSSSSCRPWVRDSDASSICSAGSCYSSSSGKGKASAGASSEDDPEVFYAADGVEFLDPRPEPRGVKLAIDRSDPLVVVIKVTLPGFSLDNITVAMRRGHKIHIVADSYDSNDGGHFEKLISLGADVSSAAPRAEFNGTELNVYVQRRVSRHSAASRVSSAPTSPALTSPAGSISSPELGGSSSGLASYFSAYANGYSHGSDPDASPADPSAPSPPIVTRSTAEERNSLDSKRLSGSSGRSYNLTGPEGAKAAAKAAREEAASRAKEAAKGLTKGGRKAPFRRDTPAVVPPSELDPAGRDCDELATSASANGKGPERSGTIRASNSRTPSPLPPSMLPGANADNDGSSTPLSFADLAIDGDGPNAVPTRPKMRGSNLTLRPGDRTSFVEAAKLQASTSTAVDGKDGHAAQMEGETPKVEKDAMDFPVAA